MPHSHRRSVLKKKRSVADLKAMVKNHDREVIIVNGSGLVPLSQRPSLKEYIKALWERRFFIVEDAKAKALRSTRDYRLWRLWLVVNPLFDVVLYGFLFGFLFKTANGIPNFVGFLFIGITFMKMMSGLLTSGSGLITASRSMIRAFNFPIASIPLSQTLRAMIDNSVPAVVSILAAFLLQWGHYPNWTIVFLIPLFLLLHIFGSGLMMLIARFSAQVPDIKVVVGLLTQAWFFLSGVMFSLDRFANFPKIHAIMAENPAYLFLTAIRNVSIYGQAVDAATWGKLLAWTFITFLVGFIYFWRGEDKYVRIA